MYVLACKILKISPSFYQIKSRLQLCKLYALKVIKNNNLQKPINFKRTFYNNHGKNLQYGNTECQIDKDIRPTFEFRLQ